MVKISFHLLVYAMLLWSTGVKAQTSKPDSLKALLITTKDTARVNLLNQISSAYWYSNPQKTFEYANQAFILAEKLQYKKGIAAACNNTGVGYYQQNKYTEALKWYDKAIEAHKQAGNFRGEAYVITNMGLIYWKIGEFPIAVKYYLKALKIWEEHHIQEEMSSVFDNLGNVYNEQEDYDRALDYYFKAVDIQKKYSKSNQEKSMTLSNIGSAYLGKEKPKEALAYFLSSLELLDKEEQESRAVSLSNIGLTYVEMKDHSRALPYLLEALKLQRQTEDNDGMIHTLVGLSKAYKQTGQLTESATYANQALQLAQKINDKSAMAEVWLALSDVAMANGDYQKAYRYYINYAGSKDSIQNKENIYKIASLQAGLETEKKQAELELLKKDQEKREFIKNAVYSGLMALLIIAGLIVSRQRLKIRQNKELVVINRQLIEQSGKLEAQTLKLQELDKIKGAFFANISHEFRTPLTLILNSISDKIAAEKSSGSTEESQQYALIHRNARRLLTLINQLLDLSKLEEGKMNLNAENIDLTKMFKLVHASFLSLSESRKVAFTISIPQQPVICRLDADKIEKILYNLLSNAFKFTPVGGTVLLKAMQLEDTSGKTIEIAVEDSGPGIPANQLSNIFNRFYQGNQHYSDAQGTGIGLALSKELAELLGGKIWAESEEGKGSRFIVQLPLHETTGKEDFNEQKILQNEFSVSGALINVPEKTNVNADLATILVVEDNDDLRHYIIKSLRGKYNTMEAENGARGLNNAFSFIPDLIISDWMMPEMDGITLCRELKKDQRTSHIPVILLTALASNEAKWQGLETGADDYLTKPFDNKELLIRIGNLIESRKQLRERFSRELFLGPRHIPVSSMDEKFLEKVMEAVETHMGDPDFSMEKFGQQVSLSRMQLHRKLKALTGESPGDFLRKMRLQRARRLLESKAGNVSEVSYEVGFNNLSYFSRCYREEFGFSPSESA